MAKSTPKISEKNNGWRLIQNDPPPKGQRVLVTNNLVALDANGQMSHVWISTVRWSDEDGYYGYEGNRKIYNLVAWHPLPSNKKGNARG